MELVLLTKGLPETEPKLRIYGHYAVFNAAAVALLGLEDGDYVQFAHPAYGFRKETYVRKTSKPVGSYIARKRKETMRVSSRKLSELLAERLEGNGCYRVCPEEVVKDEDGDWYSIFFKNYDKKDSD